MGTRDKRSSRSRSRAALMSPGTRARRAASAPAIKSGAAAAATGSRFALPAGTAGRDPMPSESGRLVLNTPAKSHTPSMTRSVLGRAAGRAKGQRRVGFGADSHRTITGRWQRKDKSDSPSSESSFTGTGWAKMPNYNYDCVNSDSPRTNESNSDFPALTVQETPKKRTLPNQKRPKGILKRNRHSMPAIPEIGSDSSDNYPRESRKSHPLERHKVFVQKKRGGIRPRAQSTLVYPPRNRPQIERGFPNPPPGFTPAGGGNPPLPNPRMARSRRTRSMHCRGCAVQ